MKKLLLLLLIPLSTIGNQSWVRYQVMFDYYAPTESNFFMVSNNNGDTVMYHQPTVPYEFLDTLIQLDTGYYTVSLTDNFGDGWTSNQPAWFKMGNICQGLIINWDPVIGSFFQRDTVVHIMPCPPPGPPPRPLQPSQRPYKAV